MKLRNLSLSLLLVASLGMTITSCGTKDADVKAGIESVVTSTDVTVGVEKGVATLTGEVATEAEKESLEAKAKEVKGVKSVVNNITVKAPVEVSSDAALNQALVDATKDVPTVKAEIKDGVVTLTGTASKEQRIKVLQAVNAAGPQKVVNKIEVK